MYVFQRVKVSAHAVQPPLPGKPSDLFLASVPIPLVLNTVHLGVQLSSSLSWSAHIAGLVRHVAFKVYLIKRLAYHSGAANVAKRLYLGLVRPVLEYAGPVWDSCTKADCLAVERVQLFLARASLRCSHRSTSNVDVLSIIGWPTLAWRRRRFKRLLLWHLLHGG